MKKRRAKISKREKKWFIAAAEFEDYCEQHPRSPAAVRRPAVYIRAGSCVALLGQNLQSGIAGIGSTVKGALRAFDAQYRLALRPPRPSGSGFDRRAKLDSARLIR